MRLCAALTSGAIALVKEFLPGDGGDAAPPNGIAMCHTRGVEAQAEGEGVHGRS
jgi:hypothetical protein